MSNDHVNSIMRQVLDTVSPPLSAALHADRQMIGAATSRIRELEEKLAYAERTIEEMTDQLATVPHYPMIAEKLGYAYHTLRPNRYMGESKHDAERSRELIAEALEIMGIKQP